MYSYTFKNAWVTQKSIKKYEKLKSGLSNSVGELSPSRFVMFNYPRSGSNLVCGMLNQHPEILSHREVFNPKKIYYSRDFQTLQQSSSSLDVEQDLPTYKLGVVNSKIERDLDPEGFCFKLWKHHYGAKAVGFNIFPSHIPNMSVNLVRDRDLKKILLIRRNKLKCYVSRAIARRTGVWDLYGKTAETQNTSSEPTAPVQVKVNPADLLQWSQKYDEYFEKMRRSLADQDFLELCYEEVVGSENHAIKSKLLNFIGVSPETSYLTPPLKKQNSKSIADLVSNYSELQTALTGTDLEPFV